MTKEERLEHLDELENITNELQNTEFGILHPNGTIESYNCDMVDCYNENLAEGEKPAVCLKGLESLSSELKMLIMLNPELLDFVLSFYVKLDWSTATDQEKIDKLLAAASWQLFKNRCLPNNQGTEVHLDNIFDNLPNWSSLSVGAGDAEGEVCLDSNPCGIAISFRGDNQCDCVDFILQDPRDLGSLSYANDFYGCSENSGTSLPCLTIYVDYGSQTLFEQFMVRSNLICP